MDFNRAGPLTNATLAEFERLERYEDGRGVLVVDKHKSSATHGPANLPLTPDIVQGMDMFVEKYRPKLTGKDTDMLFKSAKPDKDIKMLALDQGMKELARKLTPTMLRKVAGTTARSTLAEADCEQLANLMCHQPDTQRRHYAAKQRKKSNLAVAALMESELFGSDKEGQSAADGDEAPAQAPASRQVERKRKPFGEPEMNALFKAMDQVTLPLTVEQVVSLKEKYPVLGQRSTKVVYNKLKDIVEANKRTRMWVISGGCKRVE